MNLKKLNRVSNSENTLIQAVSNSLVNQARKGVVWGNEDPYSDIVAIEQADGDKIPEGFKNNFTMFDFIDWAEEEADLEAGEIDELWFSSSDEIVTYYKDELIRFINKKATLGEQGKEFFVFVRAGETEEWGWLSEEDLVEKFIADKKQWVEPLYQYLANEGVAEDSLIYVNIADTNLAAVSDNPDVVEMAKEFLSQNQDLAVETRTGKERLKFNSLREVIEYVGENGDVAEAPDGTEYLNVYIDDDGMAKDIMNSRLTGCRAVDPRNGINIQVVPEQLVTKVEEWLKKAESFLEKGEPNLTVDEVQEYWDLLSVVPVVTYHKFPDLLSEASV